MIKTGKLALKLFVALCAVHGSLECRVGNIRSLRHEKNQIIERTFREIHFVI